MVNVVFIHPDLGIGGAERSVIDAAIGLKSKGHNVQFVTSHHDTKHCFQETKDGTLKVTAVGDWLPRSICGKCYAVCAYIRMIYAAIYLIFFSSINCDLIFCDQISACIPILRLKNAAVVFYCHFPDMLLTQRKSLMKKIYRAPIDWLEEKTTGMAHCVFVNSKFTAGIFKETFKTLSSLSPEVLYPIPDFSALDRDIDPITDDIFPADKDIVFLSINRYERKKNLALALKALACLKERHGSKFGGVHLVMAGGYDARVTENKEHYMELKTLAEELDLVDNVTFVRSFSDAQKRTLLHNSTCLLYTPDREHFGIVPVEAMYMRCPVVAVKSGGPLETVEHNVTGYLCQPDPEEFADAMEKFFDDKNLHKKLGEAGRTRVQGKFSFTAFTNQLDNVISKLASQKHFPLLTISLFWFLVVLTMIGLLAVALLF